uniref:EOG090X0F1W n=1 Tax=Evadne anonyx TaxID=141404 RepID=A0A9N6ZFM2_9CRUS|nr:EOG090X0F1W [Evadne anonyx]
MDQHKSAVDTVVVTGFGPFGNHSINASMETVKLLPTLEIEKELDIKLILQEIPVKYDFVKNRIPKMWELYRPKLMVHVGVSGKARELNLEQQAFNNGYVQVDISGCIPDGNVCYVGCEDVIKSGLDMNTVCQTINNSSCGVTSSVSDDPGRYLCDFTFYNSLCISRKCSAFVHVPSLDQPYSALQLAQALKVAIAAMLEQIRQNDKKAM